MSYVRLTTSYDDHVIKLIHSYSEALHINFCAPFTAILSTLCAYYLLLNSQHYQEESSTTMWERTRGERTRGERTGIVGTDNRRHVLRMHIAVSGETHSTQHTSIYRRTVENNKTNIIKYHAIHETKNKYCQFLVYLNTINDMTSLSFFSM